MNLARDAFILEALLAETRGYVLDILASEHRNTFGNAIATLIDWRGRDRLPVTPENHVPF